MKNYKKANIKNYHLVQEELLSQFLNIIGADNIDHASKILVNGVRTYKGTPGPLLKKYFRSLKHYGKIVNMTYWVTGVFTSNRPHIDGTSTFLPKIKLIMPVANCEGTTTKWFNYSGKVNFITIDHLELFRPDDLNLLEVDETVEMLDPIWARVDRFHTILNPFMKIRVACSVVFEHQDLLEQEFNNRNLAL